MKKGRKKDHIWRFVKYLGDASVYAKCRCGYKYRCDKGINGSPINREPNIEKLYYYCPICGSRKTRYIDNIEKINKYSFE